MNNYILLINLFKLIYLYSSFKLFLVVILFIDTEYKILFFFDNYLNKMIQVEQRLLGSQGLSVSCQGLGTAGMTAFYFVKGQETDEEEKINTIGEALKIGIYDKVFPSKLLQPLTNKLLISPLIL